MKSVTVSAKYQVVIPKELRRKLTIKPGQKVYLENSQKGTITIKTRPQADRLYGSMPGAWGKDSTQYLRKSREEANNDRT